MQIIAAGVLARVQQIGTDLAGTKDLASRAHWFDYSSGDELFAATHKSDAPGLLS